MPLNHQIEFLTKKFKFSDKVIKKPIIVSYFLITAELLCPFRLAKAFFFTSLVIMNHIFSFYFNMIYKYLFGIKRCH